jgi:hypothetical protein
VRDGLGHDGLIVGGGRAGTLLYPVDSTDIDTTSLVRLQVDFEGVEGP